MSPEPFIPSPPMIAVHIIMLINITAEVLKKLLVVVLAVCEE
jgi:hypothetical protein